MIHVPETNYFYKFRTQLKEKTYPSGVFETVPLDSMISTNRPVFFRENIDRLIREANSKGTQVVLSTFIYSTQFPEFYPEMATPSFQLAIGEHNQVLRDLSMKHDVSLIDLANELKAEKEWFTDGMHFNFTGNQKRVEVLKDFLVPVIEQASTKADH